MNQSETRPDRARRARNKLSDTIAEFLQKVRLGQDGSQEFMKVSCAGTRIKEPSRDKLADTLAAFANANGGVLVLGVSCRKGCVTGVPLDALDAVMQCVKEVARSAIDPPLPPVIEKLELPDADGRMRPVLKVEIPRGLCVHRSPGGYLHRVGDSVREMDTAALVRLFEQRGQLDARFDRQVVVEDASLDDLDPRLVDRFVGPIDGGERTAALAKLDMVAEDEAGVARPTVTGLLFGTRWPQRWLPQAFIQSVAYRGESVSEALRSARYQLDAKDNDGPIDDQIEYACRFVARNQRVEASKHMGRRDWPQYDLAAVCEAVVNAVAHRDYSIRGSKVRLRMFSDRIELYSPGALPNSMRIADLSRKRSERNPAIARLLARCAVPEGIESLRSTLMARKGDGVPALFAWSRSLSGKEPVYELFGNELRLTIYAADPAAEGST